MLLSICVFNLSEYQITYQNIHIVIDSLDININIIHNLLDYQIAL